MRRKNCYFLLLFVQIHLEKTVQRWWEALIKGEPKIELSKIDCSRPIDDLGDNEQMKVQELMWNHQQKLLGRPTSEQIVNISMVFYVTYLLFSKYESEKFGVPDTKIFSFFSLVTLLQNLEKVLKKAWNVEGSPFKGSKYDPSVLNFN